jgi:hypothetical protein
MQKNAAAAAAAAAARNNNFLGPGICQNISKSTRIRCTKFSADKINILGGLVEFFLARTARARARGTRAHVRNVPSSVLAKLTVRNLESSCTGCMFLLFEGLWI